MSITSDLRELLGHYLEMNANDCQGMSEEREYGGIRIKRDNDRHYHVDSIPAALTFSEYGHAFFVERLGTVIPYKELKDIAIKYSKIVEKNESYSNIIDDSYDVAQLHKDIDDNWDENVYSSITMLLDKSIFMFIKHFGLRPGAYEGINMFFYPSDIRRIIEDEHRYKSSEEERFNLALSLSGVVKENMGKLTKTLSLATNELEDNILCEIFRLYDKDYLEFKLWASKKSGYGISGHIAVKNSDWSATKNYWELIKNANPRIFISNRFVPDDSYRKSYSSPKMSSNFIEYVDQVFEATDIEEAWLKLSDVVYAAFYGKPLNA